MTKGFQDLPRDTILEQQREPPLYHGKFYKLTTVQDFDGEKLIALGEDGRVWIWLKNDGKWGLLEADDYPEAEKKPEPPETTGGLRPRFDL